ncbi:restriction endonuclease subunit S [Fusobacterium polymorphum]
MNKNIQYKKLTDICEIITGEWGTEIKENSQNIVSVIRTTNFLNNGKIDIQNKELVKREMDKNKIEQKKLKKGDIIIEKSGGSPNQPVGRVVFFNLNSNDIFLCNNFTSILRIKEKINSKYIFYFLRNSYKNNKVLKFQNKTTGIINLKLQDYLNGSCIYLPELRIQNKVVNILDILESILEKNQNYLNYLKELTKSLFTKYSDSKIVKSFYIKDISSELFAGGDKPNDYSETTSKEYIYPVYSNGEKKKVYYVFQRLLRLIKKH